MNDDEVIDGLQVIPTSYAVAEALQRVETRARAKGLTIFARIDFAQDARDRGLALRPTGLLILGNPKSGTALIETAPSSAIDLPLKVLAWLGADGGTRLAYNDPAYVTQRHRLPFELQRNIAGLGDIVQQAARPDGLAGT